MTCGTSRSPWNSAHLLFGRTDPFLADTDGDGVSDEMEACGDLKEIR